MHKSIDNYDEATFRAGMMWPAEGELSSVQARGHSGRYMCVCMCLYLGMYVCIRINIY